MYKVEVYIEDKKIENFNNNQRKKIIEKALTSFYDNDVRVEYKK